MKTSEAMQSLDDDMLAEALDKHLDRMYSDPTVTQHFKKGAHQYGVAWHPWIEVAGIMSPGYPGYEDVVFDFGNAIYGRGIRDGELNAAMAGFTAGLFVAKDCVELVDLEALDLPSATDMLKKLSRDQLQVPLNQHIERLSEVFDEDLMGNEEIGDGNELLDEDDCPDYFFGLAVEVEEDEQTYSGEQWDEIVTDLLDRYPAYINLIIAYVSRLNVSGTPTNEQNAAMAGMIAGLVVIKDAVEAAELNKTVA